MSVLNRLWSDEVGFIISTELMIVATVLVLGILVGLVSIREQLVQELSDVAEAISNVNQSYSYSSVTGHTSSTAGSQFIDLNDFCDDVGSQIAAGVAPNNACVNVNAGPTIGGE